MAGRSGSAKLRQESNDEIDRVRLTLTRIGGLYADAVEKQSWRAFLVANGVLAPQSSVTDWFQIGASAWVEGVRDGVNLIQGICSTVLRPSADASDRKSGVYGDQIVFYVDDFTEATSGLETDIPVDQINNVRTAASDIPPDCINLTISSDQKKVLVALYKLIAPPSDPLEDGVRRLPRNTHTATLVWGKGASNSQKIVVNVATTAP